MAVPTLSACAPASVFSGGMFVTITGTNFQVTYAPPDSNGPLPPPLPSMAVTFNGVPAKRVRVQSSSQLTCIAPAGDPGPAAIVVQNLDVSGAPIGGEAASSSAFATYARADLSLTDDMEWVTRSLIRMLKREVIENVVQTVSVDYTGDGNKSDFNITDVGDLPAVSVAGPMPKRNKFYGNVGEVETRGSGYVDRFYMRTSDLVFKIAVFADATAQLLRLQSLVTKAFENNTRFDVQRDPSDITKGFVTYDLDAEDIGWVATPSNSDVRIAAGEIRILGFTFGDVAGFVDSTVADKGENADNIELQTTVAL